MDNARNACIADTKRAQLLNEEQLRLVSKVPSHQ